MLEFLIGLASIIIIDLVVSGDNAMVIALASRNLPEHQRKKAILWGTFGAILIRIVLTVVAVYLLKVPLLQAIGGVFLIWVAVKLLVDNAGHEEGHIKSHATFGKAIRTIIFADVVLSLDNIFAVAAAGEGHLVLVLIGLAISIPILVWGSSLILKWINRFPILIYIGSGVLGWTAGKMLVSDQIVDKLLTNAVLDWVIPLGITVGVILLGKWWSGRNKQQRGVKTEL